MDIQCIFTVGSFSGFDDLYNYLAKNRDNIFIKDSSYLMLLSLQDEIMTLVKDMKEDCSDFMSAIDMKDLEKDFEKILTSNDEDFSEMLYSLSYEVDLWEIETVFNCFSPLLADKTTYLELSYTDNNSSEIEILLYTVLIQSKEEFLALVVKWIDTYPISATDLYKILT